MRPKEDVKRHTYDEITVPNCSRPGRMFAKVIYSGIFLKKMLVLGFRSLEPVGLIVIVCPSRIAPFKTLTPCCTI